MSEQPDRPVNVQEYIERGDPYGWFNEVYARAGGDGDAVPWAHMIARPAFADWLAKQPDGNDKNALIVACGLGDDAEALAARVYDVTAFDVAPTAIEWSKQRFPNTNVNYLVADLFKPPPEWVRAFDFVLEIFTVQALPIAMRAESAAAVAQFVAPGGTLLNVCLGVDEAEGRGGPPWPFTRSEVDLFTQDGLVEKVFDVIRHPENASDVARQSGLWRIAYERPT